MDKNIRIEKLKEILANEPFTSGIRIPYRGEILKLNAYQVPLEYLIYNKYNGRVASLVKSFEKQRYELDAENTEHASILEKFLWDSKPDRNDRTLEDLLKNQQREWGIVTFEGKIIDGNRRAMLIRRIYEERNTKHQNRDVAWSKYFIAVILPDEITDDREISKLETIYQMGEDRKLEYNPIEKYLKCKDLKVKFKFDEDDIAGMMGENPGQINQWLRILEVMEEYLEYMDYEGIYTRLERREGQFVDLTKYLDSYQDANKNVQWAYAKKDVADLQSVAFDYIRAQYEGKDFRSIGQSTKSGSFFHHEDIWREFVKYHKSRVDPVTANELSVAEWRQREPGGDLTSMLRTRDEEWAVHVADDLKANLGIGESRLENRKEANLPLKLVQKAYDTLQEVNTDLDGFYDESIDEVLANIIRLTNEYRKLISKS